MSAADPRPLFLARLAGTQAEMGAQHGRLVAGDAAALVEFYRAMPERQLVGDLHGAAGTIGRAAVRRLARAWMARLARDRPAELVARSRGFADAIGVADSELSLATMDAMQNCVALAARGRLGPFAQPRAWRARAFTAATPACSTVIAWGSATVDGELYFARNFDFPGVGVWDAAPAFVACAPAGGQRYGFFATRGADAPVVTVVNEAGLVFAPHTRWHAGVTWGGAMIVDTVHELARRAESLDDAIAIARERPISSSWGIAVGSAREQSALVLEIAGGRVEVVRPAAGASTLVCANRYRSAALQAGEVAGSEAWAIHSDRREKRLRELLAARRAPLAAEDLVKLLGDRLDCGIERHLGAICAQPLNVHAAVVAPAARRALVGIDRAPCCEGRWAELAWEWDGPRGGWELGATAGSGFTARVRDDLAAPHDAATRAIHDAARAYEGTHDVPAARAALERAVDAAPDDPSLRLAAAWAALEDDADERAAVHCREGLANERDAYRRGQLLAWGARAARRSDRELAARWLGELDELARARDAVPGMAQLAAAARRRGRPHVNLMMADAF